MQKQVFAKVMAFGFSKQEMLSITFVTSSKNPNLEMIINPRISVKLCLLRSKLKNLIYLLINTCTCATTTLIARNLSFVKNRKFNGMIPSKIGVFTIDAK